MTNMYRKTFGTNEQIRFESEPDYYETLGYLAKDDGSARIVWENNDEQGAWAPEGRIQFYGEPPVALRAKLKHTAGSGSITSRVNCNDFIQHIINYHHFVAGPHQNMSQIAASIPKNFLTDFERGFAL